MIREHFEVNQTAVTIIAYRNVHVKAAKEAIFDAREQIERKISQDRYFQTTYEPYIASPYDGHVVKRMCGASILADVGPMAAVAGAIAEHAVERMMREGAEYAIVDNGGDIALISDRDVRIGMYADVNGHRLSLLVPPSRNILGICSSSGSVGPSVSFGRSDISTVISNDVSLADACATALGNMVKERSGMAEHLEKICSIKGIIGCLAYCDSSLAVCGDVPELVRSDAKDDIITKVLLI
ncbi:MAG: UPF0280 family protein [Methanomassiliicoccaceae archaeon]|jgi:ApbE superfamily uncharacterized protein (UPF0280 family)|nr:UPF0280 family protein [Methanomassiliicoccaceae archaeon]